MYTYGRMSEDTAYLAYNGVDTGSIGRSTLGLNIPYVHLGNYYGPQIIITGGIHARENVTSLLVMRQAFRLAFSPQSFEGGIYFLPMVNPDGALLIEKGAGVANGNAAKLAAINGGSEDFSLWKANINGVDLNNNFDALFGQGADQGAEPASHGYPGPFAFSEAETLALKNFTLGVRPVMTVSYHALGREVYWNFFQTGADRERDLYIARRVAEKLDYRLIDSDMGSTGGYKDWCINKLAIPAVTIEIISAERTHPLDCMLLEEDWAQNKDLPLFLTELIGQP